MASTADMMGAPDDIALRRKGLLSLRSSAALPIALSIFLLPLLLSAIYAGIQNYRNFNEQRIELMRITARGGAARLATAVARERHLVEGVVTAATGRSAQLLQTIAADPSDTKGLTAAQIASICAGLAQLPHDPGRPRRVLYDIVTNEPLCSTDGIHFPIQSRTLAMRRSIITQDRSQLALLGARPSPTHAIALVYGGAQIQPILAFTADLPAHNSYLVAETAARRLYIGKPETTTDPRKSLQAEQSVDQTDVRIGMMTPSAANSWGGVSSITYPVLLWLGAALLCWALMTYALLRPLQQFAQSVSRYRPGAAAERVRFGRYATNEVRDLQEHFMVLADRINDDKAQLDNHLDQQRLLTREVHHRVKNNLQIVSSLINLHQRDAHDARSLHAYTTIRRRVDALAVVHRNLYAEFESNRGVAMRPFFNELLANLRASYADSPAMPELTAYIAPFYLAQDTAVPIAFLLTELVELAQDRSSSVSMIVALKPETDIMADDDVSIFANLSIRCPALATPMSEEAGIETTNRVLVGLARQLRQPLHHDGRGNFSIRLPINPSTRTP